MRVIGFAEIAIGLVFVLQTVRLVRMALRDEVPEGYGFDNRGLGFASVRNPVFTGVLAILALIAGGYSLWLGWQPPP